MDKKKIYIAGFDVFLTNAQEDLDIKKRLCEDYSFEGLIPFDANVDFTQSNDKIRKDIYEENIKMIQESDIIIANMNNFRHNEVDSGTVFEIGYAVALNKEVFIYSKDNRTVIEKTKEYDSNVYEKEGIFYDQNDLIIEGFGAQFNIMINESAHFIHGEFEDVLKVL
ncbi:MAG TPA: nucleoside 2-deoxyribosyltransferase [Arcobacter sp.]|jgi:nucleoside 2-deoxyribosyltransferase|nr:nucleoside 2-deoxyribosyltransferase [Arcobacter sp.]